MVETEWPPADAPLAVRELAGYVRGVWSREERTPDIYWVSTQEANDICNYFLQNGEGSWGMPGPLDTVAKDDGVIGRYSDKEAGDWPVRIGIRALAKAPVQPDPLVYGYGPWGFHANRGCAICTGPVCIHAGGCTVCQHVEEGA